jgi:CDP-6-deoxy-D-xylo-4-hexulose-3-dehydrase
VYERLGYNLKITDLQAALLVSQIKKLPEFIQKRRQNFEMLYDGLKKFETYFRLPKVLSGAEPSWFGFPIYVRDFCSPFSCNDVVRYLNEHKIGTRTFFAGNLTRHPAYKDVEYIVFEELINSDRITENVFWIGVHPQIDKEQIDYIVSIFEKFVEEKTK